MWNLAKVSPIYNKIQMSREESVRARSNPSAPLLPWAFKEGKRAWDTRVSIYPRGVIVVRCMVIGRLAASILTAREPQITRKLKLPPYTPSTSSSTASSSSHSSPDRAPIRRLNTLLGSYTALPWRFGFEFSHETRDLSVDRTLVFLSPSRGNVGGS